VAGIVVGALYVFSAARDLAFGSVRATIAGAVQIAGNLRLFPSAGQAVLNATDTLLHAWPVVVAALVLVMVPSGMPMTNVLVAVVARRVEWLAHTDPLDDAARADAALDLPVAPVPLELIGAGFRHNAASSATPLPTLDPATREVTVRGEKAVLTATELGILEILMRRSGTVVDRRSIAQHVWDEEAAAFGSNTIDVHLARLRSKLTGGAVQIETVRGVGYRIIPATGIM
jgi:hypothetical protein